MKLAASSLLPVPLYFSETEIPRSQESIITEGP